VAPSAHASHEVVVRLKSYSNEGHFTLETETVFRPYLLSHCSLVTEIYHVTHPAHALRAVQVRMNSGSSEGHFTLEAATVALQWGN
jgi:hypothetical protein